MEEIKRHTAFERKISEISENDVRVKIVGTVIERDLNSGIAVVDDGSSKITVILPNDELFEKIKVGKIVRVIGILMPHAQGFELKAEIVQDFSKLNKNLYNRYLEIMKTKFK